ncbi:MAG: nucleotide sugar dehydrogenase [Proteobacteria bacterium]|nr:nucleotide sugar dehydrogenase [Pseudomonadota bacterium]
MLKRFLSVIEDRSALVGVCGLGYVGLPLSLAFAESGFKVLGFDIDESKVTLLNSGGSYIQQYPAERVGAAVRAGRLEATSDFIRAGEPDALIICVPTPLNRHREPDLSFVVDTVNKLVPHMRAGQLISLESTTYPGTTEEEIRPRVESRGFEVGRDVFVVYSPEREDPGNTRFGTRTIPKVVGGSTPACLEAGRALYQAVIQTVVPVSSTQVAELTKLLENIYRAVNIGLVNELKIVADRMGIDIREVIDAAATKPFGYTPFYPGPGLGGHCIPIDPFYLTWKAREYGVHTRFIELAGEINHNMPEFVVRKTQDALNERGLTLNNARILILGLAYKKNVGDTRESPAVEIMEILGAKGAQVDYSDPHVPTFPAMRRYSFELDSVGLTAESLSRTDCVILLTDHDAFDYDLIGRHARLIVDTRGVFRSGENVVKA